MDRQKKILIIAAAWVSAALLSWFVWAKTVAPQEEKKVWVVVASRDMPLGTLLRQSDLKMVNYPQRDVPKGVVFEGKDALNRVLMEPMSSNEPLLISKLSATTSAEGVPSTIEPGYRAVSVQITDVSGVAGLIQTNSRVDVLFTRPGTMAEATTSTILQNVKVLSTGRQTPTGQPVDTRTPQAKVVTLVLRPDDAQKLELAKNQGRISLSLRNPLDGAQTPGGGPITAEALDPDMNARAAAAKKARSGGKESLEDSKLWQELAAARKELEKRKEPDKPHAVVDVYRGDKHVQELFR
ncbi:MAG TPA: Flp pilus assembly protein CpaB [Bryobacteraceae bacterium]|nr:Flp pilus assembly protein CpaB [Bryobacteraceae bacterium]